MPPSVEQLFLRYRGGDTRALAAVFDRTAKELWRVARCLCRSRGEADDLVQATFLSAMQSAQRFRDGEPLLPWLCGILANHVRMLRRRQRREPALVGGGEREAEDPAAAAERSEQRQLLRAQVEALPPTYRAVLVLQLEHGMSAAEVAHALGRPRATVRSQLHRGLELLRRALPASLAAYSGRAEAAPELRHVRGAVLAAAGGDLLVATAVGAGVLAMKQLFAVAMVLVLASIYWAWPRAVAAPAAGPQAPASSAPVAAGEGKATIAAAEEPQRVELPDAGAAAPAAAATAARLVVRARWSDGTPAPAIAICASPLPEADWFAQRIADTDAGGIVAFADFAPGRVRVRARNGGEVEAEVAAATTTEVELAIPAGIDARGTVVDRDGSPVAGAIVATGDRPEAMLEAARSDRSGGFFLRALAKRTRVVAFAEGRVASQTVTAAKFADGVVVLQLGGEAGSVVGRVLDHGGRPLAGAWVSAGNAQVEAGGPGGGAHSLCTARTGADGSFRLLGLPFTDRWPLHAGAAGHAGWKGEVDLRRGEPAVVEIRLQAAVQLAGVVRARDGTPCKRCVVTAFDASSPGKGLGDPRPVWTRTSVQTGADGSYAFASLTPGTFGVQARTWQRSGAFEGVAWRRFTAAAGERLQWDPVLASDLCIRGSLRDDAGRPLAGWRIVADAAEDVPEPESAVTGADGAFELRGCAEASYDLACYAEGWGEPLLEQRGVESGGPPLPLCVPSRLLPSCFVAGTLAADQPAADLSVCLQGDRRAVQLRGPLRPGERFEFGPLPPGHYALQLQGPSRGLDLPLVVPLGEQRLVPGQRVDLGELRLPATGELAVELVDEAGRPVERATLVFAMLGAVQGGASIAIVAGRGSKAVAPGSYLPSLGFGGRHVEHAPIAVRAGATTTVRLQAAAAVRRTLRYDLTAVGVPRRAFATFRKDGTPLQRTWFGFWQEQPSRIDHQFTPGSWELELVLADGRAQRFPFVVTADAEAPPIEIRVLP